MHDAEDQGHGSAVSGSFSVNQFVHKQRGTRSYVAPSRRMETIDYRHLLDQLIKIEGAKLAPYRDEAGNLIVAPDDYVERMGVKGTRMAVVEVDVRAVAADLDGRWSILGTLDRVRQRVVIHMAFNMGVGALLAMTRFMSAVECRRWDSAAEEMIISHWAEREPDRASVLAVMMRTGGDEVLSVIRV
jgi:GH24 family phage-related lysozyme (muramidase)